MVKCSHCLLYVFCVTLVFSSYYFLFQIVINYLLLRILNNYFFSNYLFVLMYLFLLFLLVIDLFVITAACVACVEKLEKEEVLKNTFTNKKPQVKNHLKNCPHFQEKIGSQKELDDIINLTDN